MENKTVLIVVGLILVYLLFLRKPSLGNVGRLPAGAPKAISPKPATPNMSTGDALAAAAISAAPSIISSLGSFFSSDDSSGSDYSDSAAFSDDQFVGDYY